MDEIKQIGVVASGSTSSLNADILQEMISEPLLGRLVFYVYNEGGKTKLVVSQVTKVWMTNPWHENIMIKPIIKKKGVLPNLSGVTDLKMMTIKPLSVYEVSVNSKEQGLYPDAISVYKAVIGGADLRRSFIYTPPPSGTYVYPLDRALAISIMSAMYEGYNLVYLGYVYGTDTPVALNLSPFTVRNSVYKGLGEARMIGIFGRSGSGKSWLAAYLLVGYAKNPDMGILVLDPQGELSANFPTSTSKMPFHEMLKYACHRTVFAVPTKDLRIDPKDTYAVSMFLGKFIVQNLLLGKKEEKLNQLIYKLRTKIATANTSTKWLNPGAVYAETLKAVYDNNTEVVAKELGISTDEAKDIGKIVRKIFEKFIDQLAQVVGEVYSDPTDIKNQLRSMKNDPITLELFSSFLNLFDTRSGTTMDEILEKVLQQKAIVLLDLSGKYDGSLKWIKAEDFAAMYIMLITSKLRHKAEGLFKSGELLNVLIAIDEAHNFVGETDEKEEKEKAELKKQIERDVRETRKYGIGWLFITQSMTNFSTDVYRQLHDVFFLSGLGVGADEKHMKERVPDEYIEIYQSMPDPKSTGEYWFMHTGSLATLSVVASATFVKIMSPEEFLKMNFNMTLEELKEQENLQRAALEW